MSGKDIVRLDKSDFRGTCFEPLLELSDCPDDMCCWGSIPERLPLRYITVVGSRAHSAYAKQALEHIMRGLAGQSVCIVSGLALGLDALAHRLALEQGLATIALPGSGLGDKALYPASNRMLADEIVKHGGLVCSEFAMDQTATPWTFPKRNRLMARMADVVLVVEAAEQSGTLITARNASEYSVEVGVVPGSVFNEGARGSNDLLKQGAQVVTCADDILDILGMSRQQQSSQSYEDLGQQELDILKLLVEPRSRDELLELSGVSVVELSTVLSLLEIKGYVTESLGQIYKH